MVGQPMRIRYPCCLVQRLNLDVSILLLGNTWTNLPLSADSDLGGLIISIPAIGLASDGAAFGAVPAGEAGE